MGLERKAILMTLNHADSLCADSEIRINYNSLKFKKFVTKIAIFVNANVSDT
jgi:hypothetical protein